MTTRLEMIGKIRELLPQLWEEGRFELAKEIMGGIHPDDFTGVLDSTVLQIYLDLRQAIGRHRRGLRTLRARDDCSGPWVM